MDTLWPVSQRIRLSPVFPSRKTLLLIVIPDILSLSPIIRGKEFLLAGTSVYSIQIYKDYSVSILPINNDTTSLESVGCLVKVCTPSSPPTVSVSGNKDRSQLNRSLPM